jgi:hypothetical protein
VSAAGPLVPLAGRVALGAAALAGASALLVWAPGAGAQVRQLLGFGFSGPARDPQAALEIAATNLRLVGACLLGAWAVGRRPELRLACDAALGLLLALNAAAVGVALGAYGTQMLQAVALHGPLELAAFAWGGGAYLAARRDPLSASRLAAAAAAASAFALAGAWFETYVQLGGNP